MNRITRTARILARDWWSSTGEESVAAIAAFAFFLVLTFGVIALLGWITTPLAPDLGDGLMGRGVLVALLLMLTGIAIALVILTVSGVRDGIVQIRHAWRRSGWDHE